MIVPTSGLGEHPPGDGDGKELVPHGGNHAPGEKPAEIGEQGQRVRPDLVHYFAHFDPFAAQIFSSPATKFITSPFTEFTPPALWKRT
jgi:hypothetical protein